MVRLEGKLGPFRMNREDFIELVSQLVPKLSPGDDPKYDVDVTLGRFSETFHSIDQLASFFRDVHLPRVARSFSLGMSELRGSSSSPSHNFYLNCDAMDAKYWIRGTSNVAEARSIEDVLVEFRNRHRTSRLFSWLSVFLLGYPLGFLLFLELALLSVRSWSRGLLGYGPVDILVIICSTAFLLYTLWSMTTSDPPSFCFRHSLLFIGKEPGNNAVWALVSAIVVGIIVAVISSFIK